MEIGTLRPGERESLLDLLDGWPLADGWRGRDFFRRFIDFDPTYADENFWVVRDQGSLLSCVQIFPRDIRLLGHVVPIGGIGSVFTRDDRRSEGHAGGLISAATEAMRQRGMELSLLSTTRFSFYAQYDFASWKSQRSIVRRSTGPLGSASTRAIGADRPAPGADTVQLSPFDRERDLAEVVELHEHYSSARNGTVVRGEALWNASFELAGNPDEEFTVARSGRGGDGRDGVVVAYLRLTCLYGRWIVTELARADTAADALAMLVDASFEQRLEDLTGPSGDRADLVLPTFDDLEFTLALEKMGISSEPLEDPMNMLCCLDGPALSRRLGAPMLPGEANGEFLRRVLPEDAFVFWPADRF